MQELVAEELMSRKWRYHKLERAWLTRDETYPSPVEIERGISERGVYLWWDTSTWKKVRVCWILFFNSLEACSKLARTPFTNVLCSANLSCGILTWITA
jgi:CCR4-NOT transcription complex subunit 2